MNPFVRSLDVHDDPRCIISSGMTETSTETTGMQLDEEIQAQLHGGYRIRAILIALVCLVLGLWGIYDYVYAIPQQQEGADRRDLAQEMKVVIDAHADRTATLEMYKVAMDHVNSELVSSAYQAAIITGMDSDITSSEGWHAALATWKAALESMQQETGATSQALELEERAKSEIERANTAYGDVQAPSAYDRPIQWMFILSLLFVPFYVRQLMVHQGRTYSLDRDGNFHGPDGIIKAEEIADIDMSRWMKKSIAVLVDADGNRTTLDAYIYRNLDMIIGAIAHRLHPDQWTMDAKVVKAASSPDDAEQD